LKGGEEGAKWPMLLSRTVRGKKQGLRATSSAGQKTSPHPIRHDWRETNSFARGGEEGASLNPRGKKREISPTTPAGPKKKRKKGQPHSRTFINQPAEGVISTSIPPTAGPWPRGAIRLLLCSGKEKKRKSITTPQILPALRSHHKEEEGAALERLPPTSMERKKEICWRKIDTLSSCMAQGRGRDYQIISVIVGPGERKGNPLPQGKSRRRHGKEKTESSPFS